MSLISNFFREINTRLDKGYDGYSQLLELEDMFQSHKNGIIENWYMYHGLHNLFIKRFEGEKDIDFIQRKQSALVENHIKPIINIIASNLYQFDSVKRFVNRNDNPDDKLNDFLKRKVFNHNQLESFDDAKAVNCFVSGFSVIRRTLCDYRTGYEFIPGTSTKDKVTYGFIKKTLIDSSCCLPLPYVDENGIVDSSRFGALLIVTNNNNYIGSKNVMSLVGKPYIEKEIIEYIDDKIWLRFSKDSSDRSNKYQQIPVYPDNRNPYGDVSIPFTIYRNCDDPFSLEGDSDVTGLKQLNVVLNEISTGEFDVIRYHQYPILMGLNGASLPPDFIRTKNAVLQNITGEGKFEYLTWDGSLSRSQEKQDSLRRSMSYTSGVTLVSRGFMNEIGQIRSGPPLKALFLSDRSLMARKAKYFMSAEQKDMRSDVKYWELTHFIDSAFFNVDDSVTFNIAFPKDFLGLDDLLEAEIEAIKLGAGAVSAREVVKNYHPEWSDQQIDDEVSRIELQKKQAKSAINSSSDKKANEQA